MKTRLNPAPLTKEDGDIWARVVNASGRCFSSHDAGLYHRCTLAADRVDADMMFMLERMRVEMSAFKPTDYPRCMVHAIMLGSEQETGQVCFP